MEWQFTEYFMQCSLYSQIKWTKACILLTFLARGSFLYLEWSIPAVAPLLFFKHSFRYFEEEHVDVLYTHELELERELVQANDVRKETFLRRTSSKYRN